MGKTSTHDATDAALGYYYQAIYALIVLFDSSDEESVSIETRDDIEISGGVPRLMQLKHSLGHPPALTEKNDGLWKTISIWIPQLKDSNLQFIFVTCADIPEGHSLIELTRLKGNRVRVQARLEEEAERVVQLAAYQPKDNAKGIADLSAGKHVGTPYKDRLPGCKAFLKLSSGDRAKFIKRITILHRSFNARDLQEQVEIRLTSYSKVIRPLIARRLIEWWDYRIARSLTGRASRTISKDELLDCLQGLVIELSDDNLPDDFSLQSPPADVNQPGSMMAEQIKLVNGGDKRILRAATARWRARQQRDRWIGERVGLAVELNIFDERLIEAWRDRHGPMCDDCQGKDEEKVQRGLQLLDWSHNDAFQIVPQPRPKWNKAFLTQGMYQQLAHELRLGWHPDYESILSVSTQTTNIDGSGRNPKNLSTATPGNKVAKRKERR